MTLQGRVDQIAKELLGPYLAVLKVEVPKTSKILQDPIHGTIVIEPHELVLIDSPVFQRLRRIHQTSASMWTYPTAHHTRFEHSLGVMAMVDRMIQALRRVQPIEESDRLLLRAAALLHDAGHGPFSHLSEQVVKELPEVAVLYGQLEQLREVAPFQLKSNKSAEILTYYLVTSSAFETLIQAFLSAAKSDASPGDFAKEIGHLLLGNPEPFAPERRFLVDLISGALDADKLDYIVRDNHYTGLKLVVDVDRLLHSLDLYERKGDTKLCISLKGLVPFEQIVVSKAFLFTALYHHQKVRATDCMVKGLYEIAVRENIQIAGRPVNDPVSLICLTDYDLLTRDGKPERYTTHLRRLLDRDLPKRALCFTKDSIRGTPDAVTLFQNEMKQAATRGLRERLAGEVGTAPETLWIDFPASMSFKEAAEFPVRRTLKEEPKRFKELFPVEDWARNYQQNLYRGHLFCPVAHRDDAIRVCKEVLKTDYDIELTSLAEDLCNR